MKIIILSLNNENELNEDFKENNPIITTPKIRNVFIENINFKIII